MVMSQRPTHFLCIPLVTTTAARRQVRRQLAHFRQDVAGPSLSGKNHVSGNNHVSGKNHVSGMSRLGSVGKGVPADAVRPPSSLHLTLGVMTLDTEARLGQATELLQREADHLRQYLAQLLAEQPKEGQLLDAKNEGKGKSPETAHALHVTLRGLQSMHPRTRTSVLYSPPVASDTGSPRLLYAFCQRVVQVFAQHGFLAAEPVHNTTTTLPNSNTPTKPVNTNVPKTRPLLLHATIVNTLHVSGPSRRHFLQHQPQSTTPTAASSRGRGKSLQVDATEILDRYEDFVFLERGLLDRLAICRMGARKFAVAGGDDAGCETEAENQELWTEDAVYDSISEISLVTRT